MDADTIMRRLRELEEENKRLKSLLAEHGIPFEVCAHNGNLAAFPSSKPLAPSVIISLQEKVELFQSLFKGRKDVFAKRWYSEEVGLSAGMRTGMEPRVLRQAQIQMFRMS